MKILKTSLFACSLLIAATPSAHAGWDLVFNDEFDGTALNTDTWSTRYIYADETMNTLAGNHEQEVYSDNATHIVQNNHLVLQARALGNGKYESGMIRSNRTFYYGYFEVKVAFPTAIGVWPAFWLNSDYNAEGTLGWPPEIDGFEFVNNGVEDTVDMVHSGVVSDAGTDTQLVYADPHFNTKWTYYKGMSSNAHTFGIMWLPDSVTTYMDGIKLYTKKYKWAYSNGQLAGPAHILLNLAVGGPWAGRHGVDDKKFPQNFFVSHMRVYQYNKSSKNNMVLPNVPDLASYSYTTPSNDLIKPTLYAADLPAEPVKAGTKVDMSYHIDTVPTKYQNNLILSLFDTRTGKYLKPQTFTLPYNTQGAAKTIREHIGLAIPSTTPVGTYELRAGLYYQSKPGFYQHIPMTLGAHVAHRPAMWYKVGTVTVAK